MNRIIKAFFYSIDGLKAVWKDEAAFRQEILLASILIPISFFIDTTSVNKSLLICSVLLVLLVEILNSAIENVVDLTTENLANKVNHYAKKAKDMGSLAVLISFIILFITWIAICL